MFLFRNRTENTARLTRRWPLGLRCLLAPCAGWCCCALPQTGSCARPRECCTWLLGRGRPPAARHGSRSPPGKPVSWGPSEAYGLSNWSDKEMGGEEQEQRKKAPTLMKRNCYIVSFIWDQGRWSLKPTGRLVLVDFGSGFSGNLNNDLWVFGEKETVPWC